MRPVTIELLPPRRDTPLATRGRVERIFFGIGIFTAGTLLLYGLYLLAKAMYSPLETTESTVLGAGFTLALSSFILCYLLWPRGRLPRALRAELPEERWAEEAGVLTVYGEAVQNRMEAKRVLAQAKNLPGPM